MEDRIIEYHQNQIQILKLRSMSRLPKLSENSKLSTSEVYCTRRYFFSDNGSDIPSNGPSNSQSSSIQSNTSKLVNLYNSFSSESEEDTSIVRSESGKVYVKQSY